MHPIYLGCENMVRPYVQLTLNACPYDIPFHVSGCEILRYGQMTAVQKEYPLASVRQL